MRLGDETGGPQVLIRADASATIGMGHIGRTLALADALQQRGSVVRFAMRTGTPHSQQAVRARGYEVVPIHTPDTDAGATPEYVEAHDAAATIALLTHARPDLVVVDHYQLGESWEAQVAATVPTILAIDDLGRAHRSTMVLDTGFGPQVAEQYEGKLAAGCVRLFGPEYALLAPVYAAEAARGRVRNGDIRRVVVFFGGADGTGETEKVLACLQSSAFACWEVAVVSLATEARWERLSRLATSRPRTRLYGMQPHLAHLYAAADLAIGGGGVSTWERLACGVPSLVTILAPNQREQTYALARCGAVLCAGEASEMTSVRYSELLRQLPQPLPAPTVSVDGRGAERVADALLAAVHERSAGRGP